MVIKKVYNFEHLDDWAKISWFTYYPILILRKSIKGIELNICVCIYIYIMRLRVNKVVCS